MAVIYIKKNLLGTGKASMPFRLLRYMVELLSDIFKNTDVAVRERKGFRLPAIVPIVLYNGNDNWTAVRTYREYTENHAVFGDSIIDFRYFLFDLKRMDEETILSTQKLLDIIFSLDKTRFEKSDPAKIAKDLAKPLPELTNDELSTLFGWIKYVLCKGTILPEFEKTFKLTIKKEGGITTMKHALEVLRDEWEEEGMAKGMAKGMVKGMVKEKIKIAQAMRERGIDLSTIAQITELPMEEVLKL